MFPRAGVDAVELSAAAMAVARINIDASPDRARIALHEGDLYAPVAGKRYDLIVANPPYVSAAAMAALPPEYRHEPAHGARRRRGRSRHRAPHPRRRAPII